MLNKAVSVLVLAFWPVFARADGVQVWAQQLPAQVLTSGSAVLTPLAVSTTSIVAVAASNDRAGLLIYNGPVSALYVAFGPSVNPDKSVTIILPASSSWVMPQPIYRGQISMARVSGTGTAIVTELK